MLYFLATLPTSSAGLTKPPFVGIQDMAINPTLSSTIASKAFVSKVPYWSEGIISIVKLSLLARCKKAT